MMFLGIMLVGGLELYNEDILKVLIAVLLGAVIGLEREWRGKPAGLRTLALVSAGSAIFTVISVHVAELADGENADISRIASNIVTGVGFLGAGIIFRGHNSVRGLTTAATVWIGAAIGMASGVGNYSVAIMGTAVVLVVLIVMHKVELLMLKVTETITYHASFDNALTIADINYDKYFSEKGYRLETTRYHKKNGELQVNWTVNASRKKHELAIGKLLNDDKVTELVYN